MIHCNHWVYLITDREDLVTRLTLAKLMYDEHNRGQMRGRIILCSDINRAVAHAQSNNIEWAFFIAPGQIFLRQFWKEFQSAEHAMYTHIMHDARFHYQCTAINMSLTAGEVSSGIDVSEETAARGYPKFLTTGKIAPVDILQQLAAARVLLGVYNWPDSLRNHKLHFYKKHWIAIENYLSGGAGHDEWNSQHYLVLDNIIGVKNRHDKILWVVNNKKPVIDHDVGRLICPASGTFWLESTAKRVLIMDTNPIQLQWAKDVWSSRPKDIITFTQRWLEDKPNVMPNFLHSNQPNKEATQAIGLLNYDKQVDFVLGDYYNLTSSDSTIWVSNIFTYEPNVVDHGLSLGLSKIRQLKERNQVIQDTEIRHGWI